MSVTQTVEASKIEAIPAPFPKTEMSYVLDGDFISEGISYPEGTEFNIKPNTIHGPHTTKTGCSVLVTFSYPSVLDDFMLA